MIVKCFRCGTELDSPDNRNADYIIAKDTMASDPREVFVAMIQGETEGVEVVSRKVAEEIYGDTLVEVNVEIGDKMIQKTGVICPQCHKGGDNIIWGIHKK